MFPWSLRGLVVKGHQRGGSQLGFPTANIQLSPQVTTALLPFQNGVFYGLGLVEATAASPASQVVPVVASVGFNPQFKDKRLTVEVHFIGSARPEANMPVSFYDATVRVMFFGKCREQRGNYRDLDELIADIRKDVELAAAKAATPNVAKFAQHPFFAGAPESDAMPLFRLHGSSRL